MKTILEPKTLIRLENLKTNKFNGLYGMCQEFDENKNRWKILLLPDETKHILVKEINLQIVTKPMVVISQNQNQIILMGSKFSPNFFKNCTFILTHSSFDVSSKIKGWKKKHHLIQTLKYVYDIIYEEKLFHGIAFLEDRIYLTFFEKKCFTEYLELTSMVVQDELFFQNLLDFDYTAILIPYHRGEAFEGLGQIYEALKEYQNCLKFANERKGHLPPILRSKFMVAIGYCHKSLENWEKALSWYEKAYKVFPAPEIQINIKSLMLRILKIGPKQENLKTDFFEELTEENKKSVSNAKNLEVCNGCGFSCDREERKMQACARCRKAIYCSVQCLQNDWKRHKKICKKPKK